MKKHFIFFIFLTLFSFQEIKAQSDTLIEAPVLLDAREQTSVETAIKDSTGQQEALTCGLAGGELLKEHHNSIKASGFIPPASLMLYALTIKGSSGLYSSKNIRTDMRSTFPDFHTPVDNYLQFVPLVSAYVTGFIPGTKPRHSNGRRLWMFVQAQVLTSVATLALKHYTNELRPNGSDYLSFPSGHTAQAFMGAALFDAEYPGQLKGLKIGMYTLAGLTGMFAMMNDRHWANDVLFGAGVGILSVRLLYWSEQHWKKKKNVPK